jgi:hypothetical protein
MARITVEDCIDKLALREIAEQALSPGDVHEGLSSMPCCREWKWTSPRRRLRPCSR